MDGENVSYDPAEGVRPMFNNRKLSDVRFLVEGQTVYGHKLILAMASPVFERMFFGDLKEKGEVIEIKDLTLVGFMNALRYIYGHPIDYELFNLYESYMAADKYLVNHFGKAFFDYVKSKLDMKSSCLIYDQLIKIGEREEIPLAEVRTMVIENSRETIRSEHFTHIDQETLISLLSLDKLNIDEADLLSAVLKWVDCEVQRQGLPVNRENRRRVFQPIKSYILFTALKPEKAAKCKEIAELLTFEETGSLVLHLNQGEPFMIKLNTSRSAGVGIQSVFVSSSSLLFAHGHHGSKWVYLIVNRRVSIRAIHLSYSQSATGFIFEVVNSTSGSLLGSTTEGSLKDGMLCVMFSPPLEVEANHPYQLIVTCNRTLTFEDRFTLAQILTYGSITFDLRPLNYNFVRGFEFMPLD